LAHYGRWVRNGDPLAGGTLRPRGVAEERFWSKVDRSGNCWLWLGYLMPNGYGKFRVAVGVTALAHRAAYELANGTIPDGLEIDHLCRNRACVNPSHLEPVTHVENVRRAMKTHCLRGHGFTAENTLMDRGRRVCRACRRIRRQRERSAA
jgi:hypothetical protein